MANVKTFTALTKINVEVLCQTVDSCQPRHVLRRALFGCVPVFATRIHGNEKVRVGFDVRGCCALRPQPKVLIHLRPLYRPS